MEESVNKRANEPYRKAVKNLAQPFDLKCPVCEKPLKGSMSSDHNYWPDTPLIMGAFNVYNDPIEPGDKMIKNFKVFECPDCGDWVLEYFFNKTYH